MVQLSGLVFRCDSSLAGRQEGHTLELQLRLKGGEKKGYP